MYISYVEVFEEPLKYMTYDELVKNYWDHSILLVDPVIKDEKLEGGYVKAVDPTQDITPLHELACKYPRNRTKIITISDMVYRMMGVWPFGGGIQDD